MPTPIRRWSLGLPFCALLACSSETSPTPDDASNTPPVWEDAPNAVVDVGEGQTVSIPLTVSDPDGGEVLATLDAPAGLQAAIVDDALVVYAGYGAADATITVIITDDEGDEARVDVSVQVLPFGWVDYQTWTTADGPEEREHATMLFDSATGQAFLFGGSGYHPQFVQMMDDFWRYDTSSATWTAITPTGDIPEAAGSRRFAGAWGSGEGVLFGGYGADNATFGDAYRVRVQNGTLDFELLEPADAAPSARSLHGFVYDPAIDRYFVFGGISGFFVNNDTWMMEIVDGRAEWTELELPAAPSNRYGFFYGMDEEAGRMILYSGAQGTGSVNPANDTWALETRTDPPQWIWLTDQVPQGRRNGCGVWDASGSRLVVFGGTPDAMSSAPGLHVFDARRGHEAWSTLELPGVGGGEPPAVRSSGFGFADGERTYLGFGNDAGLYRDWAVLGYP